jgi:hypothetical protein
LRSAFRLLAQGVVHFFALALAFTRLADSFVVDDVARGNTSAFPAGLVCRIPFLLIAAAWDRFAIAAV